MRWDGHPHGWLAGAHTALVTPFTDNASAVDAGRLREHIAFQASPGDGRPGVHGILALGTTGESPTVREDEANEVASICIEEGRRLGLKVMVGTGSNSTEHAVERHRWAAGLGAEASLSVTPYYNKPMQEGLYRHFMMIADAADLPIVLYNIPGRCGAGLAVETLVRLAEHPNIVAVKDATGGLAHTAALHERCPDLIVLSGDDPNTLPLCSIGAAGVVSVIANLVPDRVRAMVDAIHDDRWPEAQQIHDELLPLANAVMGCATNPIGCKTALRLLGRDSGAMRLPMTAGDAGVERALRQVLSEVGLLGA
jgi:4-hydroxy-tetrahydrodipicolinate synthase